MNRSIGGLITNIAIACYLFAAGIIAFNDKLLDKVFGGNEIKSVVSAVFGRGDFTNILVAFIAIIAIAAGVLILLRLFNVSISILDLLLLILAIVWVVFICLDIIYLLKEGPSFIPWLKAFASHLIVLGGIASATGKFGGN